MTFIIKVSLVIAWDSLTAIFNFGKYQLPFTHTHNASPHSPWTIPNQDSDSLFVLKGKKSWSGFTPIYGAFSEWQGAISKSHKLQQLTVNSLRPLWMRELDNKLKARIVLWGLACLDSNFPPSSHLHNLRLSASHFYVSSSRSTECTQLHLTHKACCRN